MSVWVARWQAPQPPDSFASVVRRSRATKLPPALAGSTASASRAFNRKRIDIKRHTLKVAQTATMSPTRSDSTVTSARSEGHRYVISDE